MTLPDSGRIHLVGVGGSGMSALAKILVERGHEVSGSDLRGGRACAALMAMGATVHVGHTAAHVDGATLVVVSTAIPPDNPEVERARADGIPVIRRADLLAALMVGHRRILVAGTHGKTTTTSMLAVCLQHAGMDPSFAIGGALNETGTSAHHGTGGVFVAEADESDRSFLAYEPDCAVVTNVELDHPDHFSGLAEVNAAFAAFLERRTPGAPAIVCLDDPGAAALAAQARPPVRAYGFGDGADVVVTEPRLDGDGARFGLRSDGTDLGAFTLPVLGRHNVLNAAAAASAALWAGAPVEAIRAGLAAFGGAQRRFQRLGTVAGVTVVDDYAHHPTELEVTIAAARQARFPGRVVAVFQPHRYTRTAALGAELGTALAAADAIVVTDVYAAGESPEPGVTGHLVADAARAAGGDVHFVGSVADVPEVVAGLVREGDVVLTMGAGDVTEVGPLVLARLGERRG